MATITSFFRKTPVPSLQAYFETKSFNLPPSVVWTESESDVASALIAALDSLAEADREALILEVGRIIALADEPGQNALLDVVQNRRQFDLVAGGHNRALWMRMHEPRAFQLAEEVRYNDERRRGRMWSGYVVERQKLIRKDQLSVEAFTAAIRAKFGTDKVHVDVFDRHRVTFDGASHQLVQVAIYREGSPDDALGFDGNGKLHRRIVKPVYEACITYEPSDGVLEVIASDKSIRESLAGLMGHHLLGIPFRGEKIAAREYDLSVLVEPFVFATDASASIEQRIDSVNIRELRFQALDRPSQRVTLECNENDGETIWEMADRHIGPVALRRADWTITRARLVVKFVPHGKSRRAKTLSLMITVPNGCNLKGMTAGERLIGEKYLRDWGILTGGADAGGADRT